MEGLQLTLLVPQGPGRSIVTLNIRVTQGKHVGGPNLILAPMDSNGVTVPFTYGFHSQKAEETGFQEVSPTLQMNVAFYKAAI